VSTSKQALNHNSNEMTRFLRVSRCRITVQLYPKARDAKCLSVTLETGALLMQPAGWFHQVHAVDSPNMSVSYFWRY